MSLGRTAEVEYVERKGRFWYKKNNPDQRLTELELKIYNALSEDDSFFLESRIPKVERDETDPSIFYIEDSGTTLADALHFQLPDLQNYGYFMRTIKMRSALNTIINKTLTLEDQTFLTTYHREQLKNVLGKIAPEQSISDDDLTQHYWSYRLMAVLGKYDEQFKHAYTALVGERIDHLMSQYGQWAADNCLRNNAVADNEFLEVIPFDFNSIRFELRQMDEASIATFYVIPGPIVDTVNIELVGWLAKRYVFEKPAIAGDANTTANYLEAYFVGSIHKHMMLSAHRTREMLEMYEQLAQELSKNDTFNKDKYLGFRKNFDEVEYHENCWWQSAEILPNLVTNDTNAKNWRYIHRFVFENTRIHRTLLVTSSVYQKGESLLQSVKN